MIDLTRARPVFVYGWRLWVRFRLNEAGPLLSLLALSLFAWAFVKLAKAISVGSAPTSIVRAAVVVRDRRTVATAFSTRGTRPLA